MSTTANARIAAEAKRLAEAREAKEQEAALPQALAFLRELQDGPVRVQAKGDKS